MMPDRTPLSDFMPGDRFNRLLVAVRSMRSGTDKNGRHYADVKVGDWSGCRAAKFWKITEAEINTLSKADFLEISGDVESSERFAGDFNVKDYDIVPAPDDVADFLEQPRPTNRAYRERFNKLVKTVDDPQLFAVLRNVFGVDLEYRKRFFRAYAAAGVHHAFPGGLLEHTVEVAELCAQACDVLEGLDRDLLVTAALLHDIGKMEEMNQDLRAGEYTDDGCLIGHIVLGSVRVAQAIDKHNESCVEEEQISAGTKRALMHLILSHHGLPEHGAARKPAFAEAAVLYLCDNLSAKTRQHLDLVADNAVGATSAHNRFLDVQVYLKTPRERIGKAAAEEIPGAIDALEESNTTFITAKSLPVLGLVAAGSPDEMSEPHITEYRRVVPPPEGADYLVQVIGDSMIDAGINEGDLLFVRKQETASDGEIVVAHIAGEGQTVKRLRCNDNQEQGIGGPYLEAANPKYKPIAMTEEARIQGKVTGLLRDF